MGIIRSSLAGCIALLILSGCGGQEYIRTMGQLCAGDTDIVEAMAVSRAELRAMRFDVEKFDIEAGYIRTLPLSGAQGFEFWRSDSVGKFNRDEAGLHSIRRTAELTLSEQAGQICINCNVKTERLSLPERQIATGHGYDMFSNSDRSLQKLDVTDEQQESMEWIDLGRDGQLETEILLRIKSKLNIGE